MITLPQPLFLNHFGRLSLICSHGELVAHWFQHGIEQRAMDYGSDLSSRSCPATEQLYVGAGDSTALLGK